MSQLTLEIGLTTVGLVFATFGVVTALANDTQLFRAIFGPLIERSFWPGDLPTEIRGLRGWVYGAWSGTVAGFGLLLAAIAKPSISGGEKHLRRGALAAHSLWFVIDSAASVAHGAWGNAAFVNLPVFLALALPVFLGGRYEERPELNARMNVRRLLDAELVP